MNERIVACLSCFAPNNAAADFCENCGAPIGATSNLDPIKTIRSEAFLLEKATVAKPKMIVLIGTWLMFFPMLAGSLMLAGSQIFYGFEAEGFIFFWIGIGLAVAALIILYRVTKNYFTPPVELRNENP